MKGDISGPSLAHQIVKIIMRNIHLICTHDAGQNTALCAIWEVFTDYDL